MEEDYPVVVIDQSEFSILVGFAGEDYPTTSFSYSDVQLSNNPIAFDGIVEWEDIQQVWRHAFEVLNVDPSRVNVLITNSIWSPIQSKEYIAASLFENFKVRGVFVIASPVVAAYQAGLTTGIVIECDEEHINVVPIYEGYVPYGHFYLLKQKFASSSVPDVVSTILEIKSKSSEIGPSWGNLLLSDIIIISRESITYEDAHTLGLSLREALSLRLGLEATSRTKIKISKESLNHGAWTGASVLGCLMSWKVMLLTANEYLQKGASLIHSKQIEVMDVKAMYELFTNQGINPQSVLQRRASVSNIVQNTLIETPKLAPFDVNRIASRKLLIGCFQKQGRGKGLFGHKNWKKRHFILELLGNNNNNLSCVLHYYEGKGKNLKGTLKGIKKVVKAAVNPFRPFLVEVHCENSRVLLMDTENAEQCAITIKTLQYVIAKDWGRIFK